MPKRSNIPPILPLKDFERIFRVIHGVLLQEQCNPSKSCLYFGVIGATLLRMHYKLPAEPVVGVAAYCLNNTDSLLIFADEKDGKISLSSYAFHCWVQVNGWFIDFSSPLFPEMLASAGIVKKCGRKMFQKRLIESSVSVFEPHPISQFYCCPNFEQTRDIINDFLAKPFNADINRVCGDWFVRPPKEIMKTRSVAHMSNTSKIAVTTSLSPLRVNGVW